MITRPFSLQKKFVCLLCLCCCSVLASKPTDFVFELSGAPLQMEWKDINGDGLLDLVALMVETRTEGIMDTWYAEGGLRGLYTDQTFREKYLVTYLQKDGTWVLAQTLALGQVGILGFALGQSHNQTYMMLWHNKELVRHRWEDHSWTVERSLPTPGLLAEDAASMMDFPFWYESDAGAFWLVPDFGGVHVISLAAEDQPRFIPYPSDTFQDQSVSDLGHKLSLSLPRLLSVDADPLPELVFQNSELAIAHKIADTTVYRSPTKGVLADFNGDGMLDLMTGEEDDVDRMKDLPKVGTHVQTFLATAPFQFSETPTADQKVPGMVINGSGGDSDLQLAQPFLDINHDNRCDLAGIAIKLSMWQASKVLITGHMNIKFLLSLSVQNEDGSFRVLPGGPFQMEWKLNLRRLTMPSFAEMAADFDGDGWSDLLVQKEGRLEVTPVSQAGISASHWTCKLPDKLTSPDQVYGRDLNGDGKASFVVVKLSKQKTVVGILEAAP